MFDLRTKITFLLIYLLAFRFPFAQRCVYSMFQLTQQNQHFNCADFYNTLHKSIRVKVHTVKPRP